MGLFALGSIFLPFLASFLILSLGEKRETLRDIITVFTSFLTFAFVLLCTNSLLAGELVEMRIVSLAKNVDLYLKFDAFGAIFANLSSFLWILVSIYSFSYMRALGEHNQGRFYSMFAMAIGSALGVAYSGNVLTMYLFYEILTLSTYPLVLHEESEEAIKAGRKYLAYLLSGAGLILFAMVYTYLENGTLDFLPGGFFRGDSDPVTQAIILISFFVGFGIKAAIMPFHEWLPSAMVAPTPVSALLHAVAVVKAGVFCVMRTVLFIFGPAFLLSSNLWFFLALFVSFTVIMANVLAISEDNLKRRLAFSTVNNLSVIILGSLLLTHSGVKGALLHMVYHGFMKITLFMCAGAIYVGQRKSLVSELDGVGKSLPITMFSFTVGALGLVGIPPICGFLSKWYLCLGSLERNEILFLSVFLISAILDGIYFLPIVFRSFSRKSESHNKRTYLPTGLEGPLLFTGLASIYLFLFPDSIFRFYTLSSTVAKSVLGY